MWTWFLIGYAVFVAILCAYATHVALSNSDKQRRADALKVLKLIWGTATGAGGLLAAAIKLHELGVL
jgi:hypothetical protein